MDSSNAEQLAPAQPRRTPAPRRGHDAITPSVLGPYEILGPLRSGGMATLLLGRRRGLGGFRQFVALKALHACHEKDPRMVRRFLDEARLSAHVVHPNVVHVEDLIEVDGRYYLAMEYVHGCTVARFLDELQKRRRAPTPAVAAHIAACVAEALHAAHTCTDDEGRALHIVHRDVSPQNVLLAHTGHIKLIDFGIAKADARLHESTLGRIVGKLRYASPEQVRGHAVDARADIYGLGIVLWELLTGRPLFRAGLDVLAPEGRPEVQPPSRYVPDIPPALDAIVLRALAENPDDRPATALAFRRALLMAVPAATLVDALQMADLVRSVVPHELAEALAALPSPQAHEVGRALDRALERVETGRPRSPGGASSARDGHARPAQSARQGPGDRRAQSARRVRRARHTPGDGTTSSDSTRADLTRPVPHEHRSHHGSTDTQQSALPTLRTSAVEERPLPWWGLLLLLGLALGLGVAVGLFLGRAEGASTLEPGAIASALP